MSITTYVFMENKKNNYLSVEKSALFGAMELCTIRLSSHAWP